MVGLLCVGVVDVGHAAVLQNQRQGLAQDSPGDEFGFKLTEQGCRKAAGTHRRQHRPPQTLSWQNQSP